MFLIDILLVILLAVGSGWSICVLSEGCRRLLATQTKEMTLDTFKTGVKGELYILVISTTLIGDFIWYAGHLRLHYVYGEYIVPIRFTQIVIPILIILLLYINNKMNRNFVVEFKNYFNSIKEFDKKEVTQALFLRWRFFLILRIVLIQITNPWCL